MKIPTAEEFKPAKRGWSDKWSWQLYKWLKRCPDATTIWASRFHPYLSEVSSPAIFIGDQRDGDWIHARLLRNLCVSGGDLQRYAYGPEHDTKNWQDVTDQFWSEYRRIGVCAIHGDFAHSFVENGDTRKCMWCGKVEIKITELRPVTRWAEEA